jgi:hypothetical protein
MASWQVAKHVTVRTRGTQVSAQFCGFCARLGANTDPRCAHVAYDPAYNNVGFTTDEDRRVLRLPFTIASKGLGRSRAADHFHFPRFDRLSFWRQSI